MKILLYATLIALLAGCSDNKPTLYVYNWADYIDPEIISKFEQKCNCHVQIDQFDDNEAMLAKLLAGSSGYDVIFPSSYAIDVLKSHELIQEIQLEKLQNVQDNFDQKFSNLVYDSKLRYSIPYAFSMTGICYRKDKIQIATNSWNQLLSAHHKNRVCILNDQREILGIGLKINKKSINSTNEQDIAAACQTMIEFKKIANKLDNIQYKSGIISEEFYMCMGYNSDVLQIADEIGNDKIGFFIPYEGSTCCFDEMCILQTSKNVELAYEFIDFLYDPEIALQNAKYICTTMPNKGIQRLIDADDQKNELLNISEDTLNRLESIKDVGESLQLYNKYWDKFKSTK